MAHAGHQGMVKTKRLIRSCIWFPGIDAMVERMVNMCLVCHENRQLFEPMRPTDMLAGRWKQVAGDFFGPLRDGTYYFINYCEYSRWVSVEKIATVSFEASRPVLEDLFSTKGILRVYKTDNGSPFQSFAFANFAELWGFKHQKITPYWPRANAGAESFMKKMGKVIRNANLCGSVVKTELQTFLRAYRATPHLTTRHQLCYCLGSAELRVCLQYMEIILT